MDSNFLEKLRQKYIQTPPEGMTAKPVRTMSDPDLLDLHEFLTEDAENRPELDKRIFGAILKETRIKHGLTTNELAAEVDLSGSTINLMENGKRFTSIPVLVAICKVLQPHEIAIISENIKTLLSNRK